MAGVFKKVVETCGDLVVETTLSFESADDFMAYEPQTNNPEVVINISDQLPKDYKFNPEIVYPCSTNRSKTENFSSPITNDGVAFNPLNADGSITLTLTEDEAYTIQVLCGLTADKDANRVLGKIEDLTGYECSLYDYDRTVLTDEDGSVEIKFVN